MIARSLAAEAQLEENIRKVVRKARPGATSEAIEARVRHHLEGPERTVRDDDEPPHQLSEAQREQLWWKHYRQCSEHSTTRPSS